MMTSDDFKNLLMSEAEDRAGQIDSAVSEYNDALYQAEDAKRELETAKKALDEARKTIGELTDTNMKLLEKVKYTEDTADDTKDDVITAENITIDDLFKED